MEIIYKCVVIVTGVALLILNLRNISKKKMDIGIGSWWTIMAVVLIVFGAVFDFSPLEHLVRVRNLILIYVLVLSLVMALYLYGMHITDLKKKSDELAMWVSYAKSLKDRSLSPKKADKKTDNNTNSDDGNTH